MKHYPFQPCETDHWPAWQASEGVGVGGKMSERAKRARGAAGKVLLSDPRALRTLVPFPRSLVSPPSDACYTS